MNYGFIQSHLVFYCYSSSDSEHLNNYAFGILLYGVSPLPHLTNISLITTLLSRRVTLLYNKQSNEKNIILHVILE